MLDNKKYLKDVSALYSSANKVKKHIINELDKIDEKYRRLIAEEKKKLTEQLAVINAQLECFGALVPEEKDAAAAELEKEKEVKEKPASEVNLKIVDTIFPENNEEEAEEEKKEKEDEENAEDLNDAIEEEKGELNPLDAEEDAEWDERIQSGELKEVQFEESNTEEEGDPNKWPEFAKKELPVVEDTDWGDVDQWK